MPAPWPELFTVVTKDGKAITAPVQGSGGIVRSHRRLRWVMKERLQEAVDVAGRDPEDWITSHGVGMYAKHAGHLSVWVHEEALDPQDRTVRIPAGDVVRILDGGVQVWPMVVEDFVDVARCF